MEQGLTPRQIAVLAEIAKYPWELLRPDPAHTTKKTDRTKAVRDIAKAAGVSYSYVFNIIAVQHAREIGQQARAREASMPKLREMSVSAEHIDVSWFTGWLDCFQRLGLIAERLEMLAISRDCRYAESMLGQIKDICNRGKERAKIEMRQAA